MGLIMPAGARAFINIYIPHAACMHPTVMLTIYNPYIQTVSDGQKLIYRNAIIEAVGVN